MRVIEVERCGIDHCPHCFPHETAQGVNYCHAYETPPEIHAGVKTFPRVCPLLAKDSD
jgi:hypothetical protein